MAFVMRPGSDPNDLKLMFTGQDSLLVDLWGNLRAYYNGQFYVLPQAVAYQVGAGNSIIPVNWSTSYVIIDGGGVVRLNFSSYDSTLPLVFQVGALPSLGPATLDNLCWSTYLGGTNYDQINASALDAAGNYFVTGSTASDFNTIPNNPGNTTINGGQVVLVARFHDDYHLDWLTYYGAANSGQSGNAIVAREVGAERIYVGGYTYGSNLIGAVETGAYNLQTVSPGDYSRAFIAKFDVNSALFWSTYFGNGQSEISGMDVDQDGRLHIMGYSNNQGIPITTLAGATSWPFTGTTTNTILARFTSADALEWCTPYNSSVNAMVDGGVGDIKCYVGGFYVSSIASSTSPTINPGGGAYFQSANGGGRDCLLMKFSTSAQCNWASKFGGSGDDKPGINSLTVNKYGDLYFVGSTGSVSGFPLVDDGGTFDNFNGGYDGFISMIHHGDLALAWSTFVNALPYASCVDDQSHFFAVGTTIGNSPGSVPLIDYPPYYNQSTYYGPGDGVILGYQVGLGGDHQQFYGTYFGGEQGESGTRDQIATTAWGLNHLYIAGLTSKGQDVTTFFPLVDAGAPAYYDGSYQYVPWGSGLNQNISDAFVASICTGTVGIDELVGNDKPTFGIGALIGDGRSMFGLPDGRVQLLVYDATGRLVTSEVVVSMAGRALMHTGTPVPGMYVVEAISKAYRAVGRFVSTPD